MKMFMFALYEVISTVSNTNEGKIHIFFFAFQLVEIFNYFNIYFTHIGDFWMNA